MREFRIGLDFRHIKDKNNQLDLSTCQTPTLRVIANQGVMKNWFDWLGVGVGNLLIE